MTPHEHPDRTTLVEAARVETGPVRIGDDWAGIFLRGDDAFGYAMACRTAADALEGDNDVDRSVAGINLGGLADILGSCVEPCEARPLYATPRAPAGSGEARPKAWAVLMWSEDGESPFPKAQVFDTQQQAETAARAATNEGGRHGFTVEPVGTWGVDTPPLARTQHTDRTTEEANDG